MCSESFPELNRPGRGVDHALTSGAEVKERVELYLYPPWAFVVCSRVNITFTFNLHLFIYLFIYFIYLFIYLFYFILFIYLFVYLFVYLFIYLFIYLFLFIDGLTV